MANIFKEAKKVQRKHPSWQWQDCIQFASKHNKPKKKRTVGSAKKKNRQTGSSNRKKDRELNARPPGARIPRGGKKVTYYERRKNRSDKPGSLTGISVSKMKSEIKSRLEDTLGKQMVKKLLAKKKMAKNKIQKKIETTRNELYKLIR